MDLDKTVFGDLRTHAAEVVRVQTEASVYIVAFHEQRGRRYVVVRGEAGTDREHVVIRDSDPRIGDTSLFNVPIKSWPGQVLEVATMRTSPIVAATREPDPTGTSFPGDIGVKLAPPPGLTEVPRVAPGLGRGTQLGPARGTAPPGTSNIAQKVVVGEGAQQPYPLRHVKYAEDAAALLRSVQRRDRIFADVDRELRERLIRALEDTRDLVQMILRRAK